MPFFISHHTLFKKPSCYFYCYGNHGLLAPETGLTRGYYLGSEKQANIFGETAYMTHPFISDQNNRPGVDGLNICLICYSLLAPETGYTRRSYIGNEEHKSLFPSNRSLCSK